MSDFEKMIQSKPEIAVETIANQLAEIDELRAELHTYKSGNVPVTKIISDNEGMAIEMNDFKEQVEQLQASEAELKEIRNRQADCVVEQEKEIEQLQAELDEAKPFMAAVKKRHNGYDPEVIKDLGVESPATPDQALQELQGEWDSTEDSYAEDIVKLQTENKRLKEEIFKYNEELSDALSAKLQFQAELNKHRWISVEEWLPLTVEDVELLYPDGLIIKGYYSGSHFCLNYDIDIDYDSVTHWKPIILPEKEGTQ